MKNIAGQAALAAIAALAIAGCASTGAHSSASSATTSAAPAATTTTPTAAATPNPDGTYNGSCDYSLGSDPVSGTARAIGEIDMTNTGNIGTVVAVRITWPQEGYGPLVMTRTVRTTPGQHKAVRFHRPLSQNQIDLLQSWQDSHNYRDGCTYKASLTSTFGEPQS